MTKFIFVTGGVVSGLGKGITAASLGRLLKQRGFRVAAQKLDPYMNIDPGTMSPYQHGEVYVTDDGAETDLDLGHYERFIDENLTKYSNLTSGKVYWNVLNRERNGGYLGETVQVIPHVTQEIIDFIYEGAKRSQADILITEIGGTTGDIESQPFLEAIRQIALEQDKSDCLFLHVTLVPFLKGSNEHKSKPTQHSVKELRSLGISPDIIVARCDSPLHQDIIQKISLFCNVTPQSVIENLTLPCLYEAVLMLHEKGLDQQVINKLNLPDTPIDLTNWEMLIERIHHRFKKVTIAIVGKYVRLHDAYLSVMESLHHAGYALDAHIEIRWIDSEQLECGNIDEFFQGVAGILIPGGFGNRGIEGKILACQYAREHKIPYLGICLGMQIAVIEFARHVCGIQDATSKEFLPEGNHLVIDLMEEQKKVMNKGGTMRLGSYPCHIYPNTLLQKLYQCNDISERHRHRFEFNNAYRTLFQEKGMTIAGVSFDEQLVEAIEYKDHPYFIAVQYHPEFKSRPDRAHPLFYGLVAAALKKEDENNA